MPETSPAAPVLPDAVRSAVAALFDSAVAEHRTSGVTWAIIGGHDHEEAVLAHGAAGHRELDGGVPAAGSSPMDRASVSRIASMTKSFTAATLLALRDEGRLRLEDPVSTYLPEAAGAFELAEDEREPTLRELLTMSAGLVTDNPWGDRQEAMTREEFAAVLRDGLGHVHRPGTGFEYSNTGYALLGRVIDEVTGGDYTGEIRRRFLEPLALGATGWSAEEIDTAQLATGHRLADRSDATRFEPVPLDSPACTARWPDSSRPSTMWPSGCASSPRPTRPTPRGTRPARSPPRPAGRCSSCTAIRRSPRCRRTSMTPPAPPRLRPGARLRIRTGHRALPRSRAGHLPLGRLPRVRLLHGLAPRLRGGGGGARELEVRPGHHPVHAGAAPPPAGGPRAARTALDGGRAPQPRGGRCGAGLAALGR
nr:serine hydrolase domain-containing protein [Brachybacterium sp. Z12]